MIWHDRLFNLLTYSVMFVFIYVGPYRLRVRWRDIEQAIRSPEARTAPSPVRQLTEEVQTNRAVATTAAIFFLAASLVAASPLSVFSGGESILAPGVPLWHVALICTAVTTLFLSLIRPPFDLASVAVVSQNLAARLPEDRVTRDDVDTLGRLTFWNYSLQVLMLFFLSKCALYPYWSPEMYVGHWPLAVIPALLIFAGLVSFATKRDLRRYAERVVPQIDEALRSEGWRPGELPEILMKKPDEGPKAAQAAAQ